MVWKIQEATTSESELVLAQGLWQWQLWGDMAEVRHECKVPKSSGI
jgi:hypothetical protein